jgi:hypothetical protein
MSEAPLQADPDECTRTGTTGQHHYASIHEQGHQPYWLRQCTLCGRVDRDDLDKQVGGLLNNKRDRPLWLKVLRRLLGYYNP